MSFQLVIWKINLPTWQHRRRILEAGFGLWLGLFLALGFGTWARKGEW